MCKSLYGHTLPFFSWVNCLQSGEKNLCKNSQKKTGIAIIPGKSDFKAKSVD